MNIEQCFRLLTERLQEEVVVTSAGNCSEIWWDMTGETERVFYLEASMSLASLFAAGIAFGAPQRTVVALSGDGAFAMNPGMPVAVTRLNFCRVWIALISAMASSGSAEMLKFSLARAGVFGVVRTAVPRCTAQASNTCAGVWFTRLAMPVITGSSRTPGFIP